MTSLDKDGRKDTGDAFQARATHASHRAVLQRLGLSVGIAIALTGCKTDAPKMPPLRDGLNRTAAEAEQDSVNGYLLRLGYDRWVAACAYKHGQDGGKRSKAISDCTIIFPSSASGMSAFGQDPKGLEAKPASPTANGGDAQPQSHTPSESNQ